MKRVKFNTLLRYVFEDVSEAEEIKIEAFIQSNPEAKKTVDGIMSYAFRNNIHSVKAYKEAMKKEKSLTEKLFRKKYPQKEKKLFPIYLTVIAGIAVSLALLFFPVYDHIIKFESPRLPNNDIKINSPSIPNKEENSKRIPIPKKDRIDTKKLYQKNKDNEDSVENDEARENLQIIEKPNLKTKDELQNNKEIIFKTINSNPLPIPNLPTTLKSLEFADKTELPVEIKVYDKKASSSEEINLENVASGKVEFKWNKKTAVGMYSITYESDEYRSTAGIIASHVNEKLSCFYDIEVLDRSLFPTLTLAKEDQMTEESARAETVEQGRHKGAKKLITGKLSHVEISKNQETKTISLTMILDMSLVNVETGITEKSQIFVCNGSSNLGLISSLKTVFKKNGSGNGDGQIAALRSALVNLTPDLMKFLAHSLGSYDDVCAKDEEDNAIEYQIINKHDETSLLFSFSREPKWTKGLTKLDLIMEEEVKDFSGNVLESRQMHLVTGKFKGFTGSYGVIEIPNKGDYPMEKIVDLIVNQQRKIVVMERQKTLSKE